MKDWSWKEEPELMNELQSIQNEPEHEHHDIMTIVGFMRSRKELVEHIKRNKRRLEV